MADRRLKDVVGGASQGAGGAVPFWEDAPGLWDRIKLAGLTLPGKARLSGSLGRRVDQKQVPGQDGATMTHLGYEPAKVEVTLFLWEAVHLETFEEIVPMLRPRKDAPAKPVEVIHPALAIYGIRSLFVMELGLLEPGQVKGVYEVKIQLAEYYPETKRNEVTKKSTTAKGAPAAAAKPTSKPTPAAAKPPSQGKVPGTKPQGAIDLSAPLN